MGYFSKIWDIEDEDEVPNSNLGVLSSSSRIIPLRFLRYSLFVSIFGIYPMRSRRNSFWGLLIMTFKDRIGEDSYLESSLDSE